MNLDDVKLSVAIIFTSQHKNRHMLIVIEYPFVSAAFGVATFLSGSAALAHNLGKFTYLWANLSWFSQKPYGERKLFVCVCMYIHTSTLKRVLVWERYERISSLLRKSWLPVSRHMYLRTFICIKLGRNFSERGEQFFGRFIEFIRHLWILV